MSPTEFMVPAAIVIAVIVAIAIARTENAGSDEVIGYSIIGVFALIGVTLVYVFLTDDSGSSGPSKCRACDSTAGYALVGFGPNSKWECKDCRAIR